MPMKIFDSIENRPKIHQMIAIFQNRQKLTRFASQLKTKGEGWVLNFLSFYFRKTTVFILK